MKSAPPIEMMGFMVPSYEKKFVLHGFVTDSISNEPIAATIILNSINLFVDNGSGFKISGKTMSSIITVEVSAKGFEKKKISLSIPVDWF
jgi:hypothetical protein